MIQAFRGRKKEKSGITEQLFECRRGELVIRGTEYRPAGEKLPIAIVSHGFMAFQDTVRQYAKALAELGYAAYCFDFCGGCVVKGKSDGKTTEMSVLTEVLDLEAVLGYVRSLEYIDPERVLLMGCSQGGFVSALAAAKRENGIEKLILFYPALCIPDDARAGQMMMAKFDPRNVPETLWCGPMKLGRRYVTDMLAMDPYEKIEGFCGDVLIVHGTKDRIVKKEYSERAAQVYRKESHRVILEMIEGGGHGFSQKHDALAIGMIRKFLKEV